MYVSVSICLCRNISLVLPKVSHCPLNHIHSRIGTLFSHSHFRTEIIEIIRAQTTHLTWICLVGDFFYGFCHGKSPLNLQSPWLLPPGNPTQQSKMHPLQMYFLIKDGDLGYICYFGPKHLKSRKSKSNHPMVQTARCVKWAGVVQNRARKLMLIVTKTVPSCTRTLGFFKFGSMGKIALKKGKIAYYKFHPLDSHRKKNTEKNVGIDKHTGPFVPWDWKNDVWIKQRDPTFWPKTRGGKHMEWIYRYTWLIDGSWNLNTSGFLGWWHQKVGVGIKGPGWFLVYLFFDCCNM